jgi:hypothetical protein
MNVMKRLFLLCFMSICVQFANAQANFELAGLPGAATRMGFGVRGVGMANAVSSLTTGPLVGYYNPALVPFQKAPVAEATVGLLSLDRKLNYASYSRKLEPTAGLFLGVLNAGVGDIEGRNRDGLKTETYTTSENVFILSFGTKVSDATALGISTKIFYHSLFKDVSSTTVGFDLGFITSITQELRLALVVQDINSKYKWDTSTIYGRDGNTTIEKFPLRRKGSITYLSAAYNGSISAELEWISSFFLSRVGIEKEIVDGISVRGGLDQITFDGSIHSRPSFGFSIQTPFEHWKPAIQYAYVHEPYAPSGIHFFSVRLHFE